MLIMDVQASKHQLTQAGKKLYDMDVTKVNILNSAWWAEDGICSTGSWLCMTFWMLSAKLSPAG